MPLEHLKAEQPHLYRVIAEQDKLSSHLSEAVRDYERAAACVLDPDREERDRTDWAEIKRELVHEISRLLGTDDAFRR